MDSKRLLEEKRAGLKLKMLASFRKIPQVNIPEIPTERTLFPNTKNDYWYKVELPEYQDATCCIYELDAKGVFEPHFHKTNTEQCLMLTKGAEIEVVTERRIFDVKFPGGVFFDKNVKHAVINKSDFKIELLVVWKPKMRGWNAEFVNRTQEI